MNASFDIKVADPSGQFAFNFRYRSGENHGFVVTGQRLAVKRDEQSDLEPDLESEPFAAFLKLESVPKTPPFTPEGFRTYVTKVLTQYGDYRIESGVGEADDDDIRLILPATDFLDEISITLTRPKVDQVVLLSRQLAAATRAISELRHQVTDLQGQIGKAGPSFRYDVLTGTIYPRHSGDDSVPKLLWKFVREGDVVKRICGEFAKAKGCPMDEHLGPLMAQTSFENFTKYLEVKMALKISIRFIIEALAFHGITVSEQTYSEISSTNTCAYSFLYNENSLSIGSGLVIDMEVEHTPPHVCFINFTTIVDTRRPKISSIEYVSASKLTYTIPREMFAREFRFTCSTSQCRCDSSSHYYIQIIYALSA